MVRLERGNSGSSIKKAFKDAWTIIHKDTVFLGEFDKFI